MVFFRLFLPTAFFGNGSGQSPPRSPARTTMTKQSSPWTEHSQRSPNRNKRNRNGRVSVKKIRKSCTIEIRGKSQTIRGMAIASFMHPRKNAPIEQETALSFCWLQAISTPPFFLNNLTLWSKEVKYLFSDGKPSWKCSFPARKFAPWEKKRSHKSFSCERTFYLNLIKTVYTAVENQNYRLNRWSASCLQGDMPAAPASAGKIL